MFFRFDLPQRAGRLAWLGAAILSALALTSCGGNDNDDGPITCTPGEPGCGWSHLIDNEWIEGNIPLARSVANVCTPSGEKQFVRSYLNEQYLWYDEIVPQHPDTYRDVESYFYSLLVTTPDSNGVPKDRFSAIIPLNMADSMSTGVNIGYGVTWTEDALGNQRVAMVNPGSPAALAGMARGGQLIDILRYNNDSWYPNTPGATVTFVYRDAPNAARREITLISAAIHDDPLPTAKVVTASNGHKVGYMLFTDHSEGAQDKLIDAVASLKAQGIQDLVLDLRYNSGGYLYTAATVGSMVAGPSANGKVFEHMRFNNKRASETADGIFPFSSTVLYGENTHPAGEILPALNLTRLYVLTTESTCSASEAIINALRGIDVQVTLIGSTTCGKPFGFSRQDNCGMALYPIEFKGVNAKGYGDYTAGFAPTCTVADDLNNALGNTSEAMLRGALTHLTTGSCPPSASTLRDNAKSEPPTGLPMTGKPLNPGRLLVK